ncbi:MAG: hypothetical protein HZC17_06295 [Candidatus Omnitrophica bacterium]|nr:hypothetical protein [Candidatus Omnitrophota bacterium]
MNLVKLLILSPACYFFLATSCWAGVYFESEIHSNLDPDIHKSQTFISGTKMKTLIDDSYGWIIDLSSGKLIDYDLSNKTYYEISLTDMSKEWEAIGVKMKSVESQNKQQENVFVPVLKRVKKTKKIMGYDTSLVQVDLNQTESQDLWVTKQIPSTEEVLNFWRAFYRYSSSPLKQFEPLKRHFEIMSKLDAFVVLRKTQIHPPGVVGAFEEEEQVTKVEDRNFAADFFELPKDLQRKDSIS